MPRARPSRPVQWGGTTIFCPVSAKTGEGIDEFLDELGKILRENRIHINRCFKYQDAGRIQLIREFGTLISEEYTQDGIEVEAYVPKEIYDKL